MADYRLYFLDQANHIRGVLEFECDDDRAALEHAAAQADGRRMELWSRARFIRRFDSAADSGAANPQAAASAGTEPQAL